MASAQRLNEDWKANISCCLEIRQKRTDAEGQSVGYFPLPQEHLGKFLESFWCRGVKA